MYFPRTPANAFSYYYKRLNYVEPEWNYHHFKKKTKKSKKRKK